jgi:cytochrome c-type biogenesis protein
MNISNVSLGASFIAGLLAFFSPCVLPLLPVYLSVLAGSGVSSGVKRGSIIVNTGAFILGFSAVFALLGLSVTVISQYLVFNRPVVVKVAGVFVVVLGIFLLGVFNIPFMLKERRKQFHFKAINPFSAFILGCAFSLGWTPCIGPVLSSVLLMAGSTQSFKYGFLMLLLFSFGLALPFFILALAADRAKGFLNITKKYTPYFQKIAGVMLIIMGVLLFLNRL